LAALVISCGFLLQIGCQEQQRVTKEPKKELVVARPPSTPDEGRVETPPTRAETIKPKPRTPMPKITFEKLIHDFGEVGAGTKNACEFKFTNTGDAVLKIGRIHSSCGCTVPQLAKKEYAPGESGTINVTYRVSRKPGGSTKTMRVPSNDKTKPKVTLTVKARVARAVVCKPKGLKLSLKGGSTSCPDITLISEDGRPFAIKSFKSPRDSITASFDSSVEATKFVLQPKVNVEQLKKNLNGRITIGLTHPKSNTVTVPFRVQPEFNVTPRSLVLYNAEPQKPTTRQVSVLNNYGNDFEVESAASKKGIIKVLSQEKVGNRYKFELEITPPDTDNKKGIFTDIFYVNIKGGEKLSVNCRGSYSRN
jgi:hypothetical protein